MAEDVEATSHRLGRKNGVYGHLFNATDDRAAVVFQSAYAGTFRE